jgi:hypothetical protein
VTATTARGMSLDTVTGGLIGILKKQMAARAGGHRGLSVAGEVGCGGVQGTLAEVAALGDGASGTTQRGSQFRKCQSVSSSFVLLRSSPRKSSTRSRVARTTNAAIPCSCSRGVGMSEPLSSGRRIRWLLPMVGAFLDARD